MAAFLVLALAIPDAFRGSGASFGIAYLAIVLIHAGLFASSGSQRMTRAIFRLARFNVLSAGFVLAGGIVGGTAQYVLWALGFLSEWVTPLLIQSGGFLIAPSHFVERHGLVVIIAIGESVVAVGICPGRRPVAPRGSGAGARDDPARPLAVRVRSTGRARGRAGRGAGRGAGG